MEKKMPANYDMIVARAVRDLGIPANISGYYCLIDAVKIAATDKLAAINIAENIYAPLADQYGTTPRKVSSAITRAIMIGWDRCDLATLEDYFDSRAFNARQFPKNSDAITVLAEHVRANCEQMGIVPKVTENIITTPPEAIREKVINALHELKMPAHLKGFQYLLDAITLAAEDMDLISTFALSKVLYPVVAQHFNSTPARVEYAMSYAIEVLWDVGDIDALMHWFGCTISGTKAKPTNGEFIAMIADTIRRSLM